METNNKQPPIIEARQLTPSQEVEQLAPVEFDVLQVEGQHKPAFEAEVSDITRRVPLEVFHDKPIVNNNPEAPEEIEEVTAKERPDEIEEVTTTLRSDKTEGVSPESIKADPSKSPSTSSSSSATSSSPSTSSSGVSAQLQKVPAQPSAKMSQMTLDKRNIIKFIEDEHPGAIENKQVKSVNMNPIGGNLEFESFKRGSSKEDYLRVKVTWTIVIETSPGVTKELEMHQYLETWITLPSDPIDYEGQRLAKTKAWMLINAYTMQYKDALGVAVSVHGTVPNPNRERVAILAKTNILTFDLYKPNIEAARNLKIMHQFQNLSPKSEMYSSYTLVRKLEESEKQGLPKWVENELDLICYTAAKAFIVDDSGKKINQAEMDAYFKGSELNPKEIPDQVASPDEALEIFHNMETRIEQRLRHSDTLNSSFTDPFPKKVEPQKSWLRENVIDKVSKHFRKDKIRLYGDMISKVENLKNNKEKYNKATEPGWIRKTPEADIKKNKELIEATNKEILEMQAAGKDLIERNQKIFNKQIDNELEQYRALQYALIRKYESTITDAAHPIHATFNNLKAELVKNNYYYGEYQALIDKGVSEIMDKLQDKEKELLKAGKALEEKILIKQQELSQIENKWNAAINSAIAERPAADASQAA